MTHVTQIKTDVGSGSTALKQEEIKGNWETGDNSYIS